MMLDKPNDINNEHMYCYGKFYDENGNACEDGITEKCVYHVECKNDCDYC